MSPEIIAALIGLVGTLVAAVIGVLAVRRPRDGRSATHEPPAIAPSPPSVPERRVVGNLVDFFEGVTKDSPAAIEVVVQPEGLKVFVCYDKELRVHISRVEYFAGDKELVLLSEGRVRRGLGMRIMGEVARVLDETTADDVALLRVQGKTKEEAQILSETRVPFVRYGGSGHQP